MLERERELERVDAALASACSGTGRAVVIEGAAGIGKTALLRAAMELAAARGMAVLGGRGTELEADYPFGVVRQCLEPAVRAVGERERGELLSGAASLAAPVVLDAPGDGAAVSFGVLHGLYWLVANLAERRPLLLCVDDAHWADEPSLRFLAHLVRRIDALPAALVLARRPVDQDGVLIDLLSDSVVEMLTPPALDEPAVKELLCGSSGGAVEDAFSRACHHATGGNPFLLSELAQTLREEQVPFTAAGAQQVGEITPPHVARITRARLARLDPSAEALARAVAVLGDDAPIDLACELACLDLAHGAPAADALLAAGLLEPGRLLRFRHPLLRAAAADSVTPFERDTWHRRAASLLKARGAPPEQIAVHLLATTPGHDQDDAEALREAATRAVERGAPSAAVPLLRRALEEPLAATVRTALLFELGRAEDAAGLHREASEHLRESERLAVDPVKRCDALIALRVALGPEPEENRLFLPLVDAALEDSEGLDRERRLKLQAAWLNARWHARVPADRSQEALIEEFARLRGDTPGECIALAQLIETWMHSPRADAARLRSLAERAARNPAGLLDAGGHVSWMHSVVMALRWTDQMDAAEHLIALWIDTRRRQGSIDAFAGAMSHSSHNNRARGRLRAAEADADVAVASAVGRVVFVMCHVALASCLLKRGDLGGAESALAATGLGEQIPLVRPYVGVLLARMDLRAARGEHAQALVDYEHACARTAGMRTGPLLEDWLVAIGSRHALGQREAVSRELEEALKVARWWGTDSAIGSVLRTRGRLGQDSTVAIEDLKAAIEHLERSPRRLEHARALVDLGAALRRAAHRSDSRDPLRAGYELARECGADGLAEIARQELAASGVRIRRERLTGAEALTPSERRIADMAAAGDSNAEIAQALFVTVKTVEMHLTHAYRKLDITRRAELARALGPDVR